MTRYLARRLFHSLFVLLGVTIVIFLLIHLAPGNPVDLILGDNATPEQVAMAEKKYGLDKPLVEQYFIWLGNVLKGDLGNSIYFHASNWNLLKDRLPATFQLATSALILSLLVAIPLGLLAGVKKGSVIDMSAMLFALLGQALSRFGSALF